MRGLRTGNWRQEGRLAGAGRAAASVLALVALASAAPLAQAQSVVDVLREQRLRARVAEVMDRLGPRVAARPVATLGQLDPIIAEVLAARAAVARRADSLAAAEADSAARAERALGLDRLVWVKTEPDAQGVFLERFRETYWRASDPRAGNPLDTTATTALRGRLQSVFGRPTRNADALRQVGYAGSETVQFEYWFVVNDSIPVLIMDIDGPFGRGLLLAGSEQHASLLPRLKDDLVARLNAALGPDPWVDYYRSFDRGTWYRTGYNGESLFTVEINAPAWSRRSRADRWNIHR